MERERGREREREREREERDREQAVQKNVLSAFVCCKSFVVCANSSSQLTANFDFVSVDCAMHPIHDVLMQVRV